MYMKSRKPKQELFPSCQRSWVREIGMEEMWAGGWGWGGGGVDGPQRLQPAIHSSLKPDHQQLESEQLAWCSVVPCELLLHLSEQKSVVLVKPESLLASSPTPKINPRRVSPLSPHYQA